MRIDGLGIIKRKTPLIKKVEKASQKKGINKDKERDVVEISLKAKERHSK